MNGAELLSPGCLELMVWTPERAAPWLQRQLAYLGGAEVGNEPMTIPWPDPGDDEPSVAGLFLRYHVVGGEQLHEVIGWWAGVASPYGRYTASPCAQHLRASWEEAER